MNILQYTNVPYLSKPLLTPPYSPYAIMVSFPNLIVSINQVFLYWLHLWQECRGVYKSKNINTRNKI